MTEPETEAGRALYADKHWALHAPLRGCVHPCSVLASILAIEAEVRAPLAARIAALEDARGYVDFDALLSATPPRPKVDLRSFIGAAPGLAEAMIDPREAARDAVIEAARIWIMPDEDADPIEDDEWDPLARRLYDAVVALDRLEGGE